MVFIEPRTLSSESYQDCYYWHKEEKLLFIYYMNIIIASTTGCENIWCGGVS